MRIRLTVNGFDMTPYLAEGGLARSEVVRQSQSIVGLDGTLYKFGVKKAAFSVSLAAVKDTDLPPILDALSVSPAEVAYTCGGDVDRTANFHVDGQKATAKKLIGGVTYYTGVSFSLEEV